MTLRCAARLLASRAGTAEQRSQAAALLGKRGGPARAKKLSPARRQEIGYMGRAALERATAN